MLIYPPHSAAADSRNNAQIARMTEDINLSIHFPYTRMNPVMKTLDEEGAEILKREFTDSCVIEIAIRKSRVDRVKNRLAKSGEVKVFNSY